MSGVRSNSFSRVAGRAAGAAGKLGDKLRPSNSFGRVKDRRNRGNKGTVDEKTTIYTTTGEETAEVAPALYESVVGDATLISAPNALVDGDDASLDLLPKGKDNAKAKPSLASKSFVQRAVKGNRQSVAEEMIPYLKGDANVGFDEDEETVTEPNVSLGNLDDAFELFMAADAASEKKAGI